MMKTEDRPEGANAPSGIFYKELGYTTKVCTNSVFEVFNMVI